jgi:maltose alpha-D-glucosyltransferase/alpha-amylase
MLALTNLGPTKRTVRLGRLDEQDGPPLDVFGDRSYDGVHPDLEDIDVAGYGYRWIRLRRTIGARAGSSRPL